MKDSNLNSANEDEVKSKKIQEALRKIKIAERDALKVQRENYETASSQLKLLINNLLECESYLNTTYDRINVGIVCNDSVFVSGIDKIKTYEKQLISNRETLEEISKEIDSEISKLTNAINELNSKIY